MKKVILQLLCLLLIASLFTGCSEKKTNVNNQLSGIAQSDQASDGFAAEVDFSKIDADMFTDRDAKTDYDESDAIKIELNGNSAKASDESVIVSDTAVMIKKEATYIISGTLNDGMLIVDAPDTAKLQLVFKNAKITSKTSAALYIKEADKVFVTLVGENTLENGGEFRAIDDNNIDGAIFSKQDITLNGTGSLEVISPQGHGIVGKDDVKITSGTYSIAAASHAVQANDSVRIKEAKITIDSGKDGIHSENSDDSEKGFVYIESGTLEIESEGDGISAGYYIIVSGGSINILAGGGYENAKKTQSDAWGNFGGGGRPNKDFGAPGMPNGEAGRPGEAPEKPNGEAGRPGEPPEKPNGEAGRPGEATEIPSGEVGKPGEPTEDSISQNEASDGSSMKGIKSANSLLIKGGDITVNSADDSIHSNMSLTVIEGTFNIASGDDAFHAENNLTVSGGKITVTQSYEGIEGLHIELTGGEIKLKATDDGLNAAGGTDQSGNGGRDKMFGMGNHGGSFGNSGGSIVISGGTVHIYAKGDAIDANGTIEITGGYITTTGPTSGDTTVLDYDKTGVISGGTFVGAGSDMMAQTLTGSNQGVIAFSSGKQEAGTKIELKDKNGNILVSYEPELEYEFVIISTPEIKSGELYTVAMGSESEEVQAK